MPRVLTARFMHEANTFSRVKTDMALIRRRDFHLANEIPQAFRGTRSALGATFEAADTKGPVDGALLPPASARTQFSGIDDGDCLGVYMDSPLGGFERSVPRKGRDFETASCGF